LNSENGLHNHRLFEGRGGQLVDGVIDCVTDAHDAVVAEQELRLAGVSTPCSHRSRLCSIVCSRLLWWLVMTA